MPKKQTQKQTEKQTQKQTEKQTEQQKQQQNINIINIGELRTKKPRKRRPRKGARAPGREAPMRQLPPVVYQTLPQVVGYTPPESTIVAPPKPATSIVAPVKAKTTILEDIGMVGTEGPVEIIDVPTKKETLAELITPVKKGPAPRLKPRPLSPSFDIPRMQVDPVENGPFDIPRMQVDPVESPPWLFEEEPLYSILEEPELKTSILEVKQKRPYTKSGKYSKKPEKRPISPLSFEKSFGIPPQLVYAEAEEYASPLTGRSEPTMFRSDSPEQGFFTQKEVNKFFQPKKRDTSPKPKPLIMGEAGPTIRGRKSRAIV